MTLTYFNDINVYFHMKNHYKMLKNVKSVVDTSIPQSLLKSPVAMTTLDKRTKGAANEHLRKIYNTTNLSQTPKRTGSVKKHNCVNSEARSEASLWGHSRPSTRRNPNATPQEPLPTGPYPIGLCPKAEKMFKFKQKKRNSMASSRSTNSGTNASLILEGVDGSDHGIGTPPNTSRSNFSDKGNVPSPEPSHLPENKPVLAGSPEDHEYLLFLLRITEDIISNDFYSNSDIKRIFKAHIDLNKGRLNVRKMHLHIANLCKELNINCKEYQAQEITDEPDSPRKFQNSPDGHRYVLNSEAFKSCPDCSIIRTSSLYKMQSAMKECCALGGDRVCSPFTETIGDGSSISPSLLKLLEKLSLGRVSECTEPVASTTSIVNSSKLNALSNTDTEKANDCEGPDKSPMDFETFVQELNSQEAILSDPLKNDTDVAAAESPLAETDTTPIRENVADNTELLKSPSSNELPLNLETLLAPSECNKADVESSEKASDKYESEFENASSSNDSVMTTERQAQEKAAEGTLTVNNALETPDVEPKEAPESNKSLKSSRIPILIKESKSLTENVSGRGLETQENVVSSKSLTALAHSERSFNKTEPLPAKPSSQEHLNDSESCNESPQDTVKKELEDVEATAKPNHLKVILQGSVNDDDYVMIKGPVYVYKPLLDSEPKLIVFTDAGSPQTSRRHSLDSHKTFTVENDHAALDRGIQYDTGLRSLDRSMENILELTKTAYSQFMDMKLLQSDYDLTPEKDGSENKYHHLLVDASTSVSGVNIAESLLLLSDDYLVKNQADASSGDLGEGYVKLEPKMYENNYVVHRKLESSVSMPKLKLNGGSARSYAAGDSVLRKCSSDLLSCNVAASRDSSLRSEGEAVQHMDYRRGGISWSRYWN